MFYVVGLGNPGTQYANTRHNVGFLLLDYIQQSFGQPRFIQSSKHSGEISEGVLSGVEVLFLKPDTYMNNSGAAVKKTVPASEIKNLIVIYDDVDLPLGEIKVSVGRGDGGHNGVRSIVASMGTKDFVRVRIGVSPTSFWTGKMRRPAGDKLSKHVLGNFKKREETKLKVALEKAAEALACLVTGGVEMTMNKYN